MKKIIHYFSYFSIALTLILTSHIIILKNSNHKTYLSFNIAPSSADITINNKTYKNGVYEFEPGNYKISVSADDFISKTFSVTVSQDTETEVSKYLYCADKTLNCYKKNETNFKILAQVADNNAKDFVENWQKILSIRQILPIKKYFYTIENPEYLEFVTNSSGELTAARTFIYDGSEDESCQYSICLLIGGTVTDQDHIESTLSEQGYNIDDYQIIIPPQH